MIASLTMLLADPDEPTLRGETAVRSVLICGSEQDVHVSTQEVSSIWQEIKWGTVIMVSLLEKGPKAVLGKGSTKMAYKATDPCNITV